VPNGHKDAGKSEDQKPDKGTLVAVDSSHGDSLGTRSICSPCSSCTTSSHERIPAYGGEKIAVVIPCFNEDPDLVEESIRTSASL